MLPRPPIGPAACGVATALLVALAAARAAAGGDLASLRAQLQRDSAAAVARIDRGQPDSALALAGASGAALARAADHAFAARATLLEPGMLLRLSRAREALPGVLAGERLAAASGDTVVWMCSLRMEAMVRNYLGDYARGEALAHRWGAMADASGNVEYQGFEATMMGWYASQRGDLVTARRDLERALALFERVPSSIGLPYTLNVLAGVVSAQGDYVHARELYERQLAMSNASGNVAVRLMALENLARIESRIGDPMVALAHWRESLAVRERRRETASWLVTADNVVDELLALGRDREAEQLAARAVGTAERESLGMELGWQRSMLGEASWANGHHARAKALWRSVLAGRDPNDAQPRALAAAGLIDALAEQDSTAAALALAQALAPAPGSGLEQESIARLGSQRARLLTDSGRPAEAAALARPLAHALEASGDLEWALAAWTQVVRAERRAGRADSAARAIDRATAVWERGRTHVSDPEYREVRGEQAHTLMIEAMGAALASAGADAPARAFAVAQRFKTRTLLEHLAGPGPATAPPSAWQDPPLAGLERFQRATLAPDELFLEYAVGRETTFVFAITREQCRVLRAPGARALEPALAVLAGSDAPADRAGAGAFVLAATRVGGGLLAGLDDLLAHHPALVVAADGPLHRSPVGAWIAPGAHAPLLATHRLALVPSASVLALLRARAQDAPARMADGRMLAMAGAPARDGARLEGARQEVSELASRYRGVDTWFATRDADLPLTLERMGPYRALHFAGHTRIDEQLPWRSGLLLGRSVSGEDSLLTADRIARGRLGARLVVLSSCQSGGGRVREGEGVAGLASAFLSAGSVAVVASLWVVEDRATERLMHRFYAGLAAGRPADRALREAQASLRAEPPTADPFYWAGFVLVGDGRTTLPLSRRLIPGGWSPLVLLLAVALAIALALARRRAPQ